MPISRHPKETTRYILKREQNSEAPTVFILGVIPSWEATPLYARSAKLYDGCVLKDEKGEAILKDGKPVYNEAFKVDICEQALLARDFLRAGLRGWECFVDGDGQGAPFEVGPDGKPSDDTIACIHDPQDQLELTNALISFNRLSPKEKTF